jgi:hypothetical protein
MGSRKFFSGLPDTMMSKNSSTGVNRQATNFYWPNDSEAENFVSPRSRIRSRSASIASLLSQSQTSTDNDESRRRRLQQNQSKIEFCDTVDVPTDTESVVSSRERNRHKKMETLKSRIEFYDFVDGKLGKDADDDVQSVIERPVKMKNENENCETATKTNNNNNDVEKLSKSFNNMEVHQSMEKTSTKQFDSFSDDSEDDERFYHLNKRNNHMFDDQPYELNRNLPPRYPQPQRVMNRRPRNREYYDYDDDFRYEHENSRRRHSRPPTNPRMTRRRGGGNYSTQEISDEEFYHPNHQQRYPSSRMRNSYDEIDDNNYRSSRMNLNRRTSMNGYEGGTERNHYIHNEQKPKIEVSQVEIESKKQSASSTLTADRAPAKTLSRTNSVNEAKQRYFTNLKSNIFHQNPEYTNIVEHKKPLSVRDFAASQRVGVGLPDINY